MPQDKDYEISKQYSDPRYSTPSTSTF